MTRRRKQNVWRVLTAGLAVTIPGCSATAEDDPLLERTSTGKVATPLAQDDATVKISSDLVKEIGEQWAGSGRNCGVGIEHDPPVPSADEVMRKVARSDRGPAIFHVLTTQPLGISQMDRLLELLVAVQDARVPGWMVTLYDAVPDIADRNLAQELATDPDPTGILGFRNGLVRDLRATILKHAARVAGPVTLELLTRGLSEPEATVRQAAVIALATRTDYTASDELRAVRNELDPAMQPAIDDVLSPR